MKLEDGKVFRILVSGGNNHLAMLIGVLSRDPLDTLQKYMKRSSAVIEGEPVEVNSLTPADKGVDLVIEAIDKEPGYAVRNLKKIHWLDKTLVGPS